MRVKSAVNMSKIGKKLINSVESCVDDGLLGFSLLHPGLALHPDYRFIGRAEEEVTSKVAILSGGGSGHEPFSTGYVGKGMLSGAVAGGVFASPPRSHIMHALKHLNHFYKGGIIIIIPNYTGDRLNFGLAAEKAKSENINVDTFSFGEDCASGHNSATGSRGMCGLSLTYKMSGALSEMGKPMAYIMETLIEVQKNISTLGITLQACSLPGQPPLFNVADDEMELGTGVHGEAGIGKLKMASARDAVRTVLERLTEVLETGPGDCLVVLVNNLGTTSQLEQNIICKEVHTQLTEAGMEVKRMFAGMLMTSLDMSGFQVSLLKLPKSLEEEWLALIDMSTDAPSWVGSEYSKPSADAKKERKHYLQPTKTIKSYFILSKDERDLLKKCLEECCQKIKQNEFILNELDSGCGDGDCGTTLKNLADGILQGLSTMSLECPAIFLQSLAEIAEIKMGGTSGAIYSIAFTSMSKYVSTAQETTLPQLWAKAMEVGVQTIMKYGRVDVGYRTIVDAALPAAQTLNKELDKSVNSTKSALSESIAAAQAGCKATKTMKAKAGRASYVSEDRLTSVDAGAFGFVLWFEEIGKCFDS